MSDSPDRGMRTQAMHVPGMPCPSCNARIVIDPMLLLSAAPIECVACGLEFKVNTEKSAGALNALEAYMSAFTKVRSDYGTKVDDVTANENGRGTLQTRGGRPPTRRPRRKR